MPKRLYAHSFCSRRNKQSCPIFLFSNQFRGDFFIIRCRDTRDFSRERKRATTKCVGAERIQADMSY